MQKQHRRDDGAVCWMEVLIPTESLAQDPERYRNGNKEQA
jgi:hypothetical protein